MAQCKPQFIGIPKLRSFLEAFFWRNCGEKDFFWLDSGNGEYPELGRFAFFGLRAVAHLQYFANTQCRIRDGRGMRSLWVSAAQVLELLGGLCAQHCPALPPAQAQDGSVIPLQSGLVGAVSYDFGYGLLPYFARSRNAGEAQLLLEFAAYHAVLAVDLRQSTYCVLGLESSEPYAVLQQLAAQSLRCAACELELPHQDWCWQRQAEYSQYRRRFGQIRQYLQQGEIYQLNFSQELQLRTVAKPLSNANEFGEIEGLAALYLRLRKGHPVPFAGFWNPSSQQHILSFSPERFFRLQRPCNSNEPQRISARPMKGTRPRYADPEQDLRAQEELRQSQKEQAELLMICDLLRNDLHQLCVPGSVKVPGARPFQIESYPSVWQQTAAVCGALPASLAGAETLLSRLWTALFPCGSITGAPKMRAMELIRELEGSRRHWYSGSLGYMDCSGAMEFNVLIRTFYRLPKSTTLAYHVGGGIVWDSECHSEWAELQAKCQFFLRTLDLSF